MPIRNRLPSRSKRGRPRATPDSVITPELAAKHRAGHTQDVLDWLAAQGIITPRHHAAALRFRYLHAVAYGVVTTASPLFAENTPTLTAVAPLAEDERAMLRQRYHHLVQHLQRCGVHGLVDALCLRVRLVSDIVPRAGSWRDACVPINEALDQLQRAMKEVDRRNRK